MRVCVGCQGRFHLFDLARQMERLGNLDRLYTGYPRFKVKGLPHQKVDTFPWLMSPYMALGRFGLNLALDRLKYPIIASFDIWMANKVEDCDVVHCLSGTGLQTHQRARERHGALTVCDRGSTHILYQQNLLAEEFDRQGIRFRGTDKRLIERELAEYELCDLIFVPSETTYRSFIEHGVPARKLRKNPYGTELDVFRPLEKTDNVFRVIYVGALTIRKGIAYLLEAVAELHLPNFEVWLIGPQAPETRAITARFSEKFRYLGVVDRHELHRYYSQGSVFVMPSIEEGLALVQGQAMACGLPVIATTNTGAEDLLTDGVEGFIVPIRDPPAIREKLLRLYRDPDLREEMSRAALRRVRAMGGWNDYGDRAEGIYAEALASRGKSHDAHSAL